jgi:hypothetical protein
MALALGCGGDPVAPVDNSAVAPPPPQAPRPLAVGRMVATRAAFDLIASAEGAVLVWGVPQTEGGGVRALALDAYGGVRGHEVVVVAEGLSASASADDDPGHVEDVAAAAAGARTAIAWIVRRGARSRAQATISSAGIEGFAPPRDLGATVSGPLDGSARGRIAVWALPDGSAVVAHQLEPGHCMGRAGTCARFSRSHLGGNPVRGDEPLEVFDPCEPLLVGGVVRGAAWFHGICHGGAQPATTLYAIDPTSAPLASAPDVLAGCAPIGIAPGPSGAVAVARCPEGISAQEVGPRGDVLATVRPARARAWCESGRPILELASKGGAIRLPLSEPISRLEALLDESLAPPGARAVWTGEALLVAAIANREVTLRRFQCELSRLVRTYR